MKKKVNYVGCTTKGVAYIRHHIGDRLISDKVVSDRDAFNEKFWVPFRNSSSQNFFSFLQDNLTIRQLHELTANDKRQVVWCSGITPLVKTSSLIVMRIEDYNKLDTLTSDQSHYIAYSAKRFFTESNDVFLKLELSK